MNPPKFLRIYVQDHDAVAYLTLQLIRRTRSNNSDGVLASFLDEVHGSSERHLSLLHDVMKRLGIGSRRDKRAALWVAERFGRLKLNGRIVRYSDLSRLFELEGITLLLTMRLSLFETLVNLDGLDLDSEAIRSAIERTQRELEGLRDHRVAAGIPLIAKA